MDVKGQGALEYLLLIGGAVLIAVIVISMLLGISDQATADTNATITASAEYQCQQRNSALCGGVPDNYQTNCAADTGYNCL